MGGHFIIKNMSGAQASQLSQGVSLDSLADENSQLKEDLEYKLSQLFLLKEQVEEYSQQIETKWAMNEEIQTELVEATKPSSILSSFTGSLSLDDQIGIMVKNLSIQLSEKIDEAVTLKSINR